MADDDRDFLARWSRRKRDARDGLHRSETRVDEAPETEIAATAPEAKLPEAVEGAPAETVERDEAPEQDAEPDDFSDVDFDALDYRSDYGRFMKDGVPEAIRRRALKQLWRSDPVLANVDGLNDYDDDFTDAALAVKVLKSAWQVGRGYLTDEEIAEQEAIGRAPEASPEEELRETETAAAGEHEDEAETAAADAQDETAPEEGQDDLDGDLDHEQV